MKYDPEHTRRHYDDLGDGEPKRWENSRTMMLQREVFRWHLQRRIRAGAQVLDAGCGAGVFTRQMIEMGAVVTALDLSPVQLQLCKAAAPGAAAYVEGSIVELSEFEDGRFDVVLALGGSLSYCFDQTVRGMRELVRVLRPGGVFGCSVMSLLGSCHRILPRVLQDLPNTRAAFRTGDLARADNQGHECHLFRLDEFREILDGAGLEEIDVSSPGWLSLVWPDDSLPEVGTDEWNFLLEAEIDAGRSCPGAGTHMIAWGTKPEET